MTDSAPGDMGLDVADEGVFVDDSSSPQMEDMGPPPLLSGILGADDTDQVPVLATLVASLKNTPLGEPYV